MLSIHHRLARRTLLIKLLKTITPFPLALSPQNSAFCPQQRKKTSGLQTAEWKARTQYPLIRGTIDERLYRVVKTREKWLEFLLGAPPNFTDYDFTADPPIALPDRLGTALAIHLGPSDAIPLVPPAS